MAFKRITEAPETEPGEEIQVDMEMVLVLAVGFCRQKQSI